jgi:thymidylate synthase (FAD)
MKIISSSFQIEDEIDGKAILKKLEKAGRTCYKSEGLITEDSCNTFTSKIMNLNPESVLEHEKVTVRFSCDRGLSHELVRHRLASFSQESTRYCNYTKDKFGNEVTVISPFVEKEYEGYYAAYESWYRSCLAAEKSYFELLAVGIKPQIARSVLPNSLKTEIVVTANLREWKHILELRTAKAAHPQMRELMCPLLAEFRRLIPVIFDNVGTTEI